MKFRLNAEAENEKWCSAKKEYFSGLCDKRRAETTAHEWN
jgi:hypothetical protein